MFNLQLMQEESNLFKCMLYKCLCMLSCITVCYYVMKGMSEEWLSEVKFLITQENKFHLCKYIYWLHFLWNINSLIYISSGCFFLPLTLFSQSFAIDPCHQLRVKVFGAHVPNWCYYLSCRYQNRMDDTSGSTYAQWHYRVGCWNWAIGLGWWSRF